MLWGEPGTSETSVILTRLKQAIMITRLYAMYQGSRNILIFLIVTFLAVNIFGTVVDVITTVDVPAGTLSCG
jgi:hypothetical protein